MPYPDRPPSEPRPTPWDAEQRLDRDVSPRRSPDDARLRELARRLGVSTHTLTQYFQFREAEIRG